MAVGWEFVHVCIDDHFRVAFSEIKPDEKADSAVPFLKAAVAYYKSLGVTVTRVMTDNGSCYKAFAFRDAYRDLGIKHIRTKPYTPKTNGKAERIIQTALREWGLRPSLSHLRTAGAASDLAAPIQLASAARRYKISNADHETRSDRGQPLEAPPPINHSSWVTLRLRFNLPQPGVSIIRAAPERSRPGSCARFATPQALPLALSSPAARR